MDRNHNCGLQVNDVIAAEKKLRVSNGSIEAHYEYDPFGGTTASSGSWASANPLARQSLGDGGFRFSTKYFDGETSLYYYGLRYYSDSPRRVGQCAARGPRAE